MADIVEIINDTNMPHNKIIADNMIIAYHKINSPLYKNIMCSVSGGSDSDVMLDIVYKCDKSKKVRYVWFDTGLEYDATKKHIEYLEDRYSIKIERERAVKPIPVCVREYGQPFLSKQVSEYISNLQRHGFDFIDGTFEDLFELYPKCKASLKWWCDKGDGPMYCINYHRYLKEFMLLNPPKFRVSSKCCDYAKKKVSKNYVKNNNIDLVIIGVRKSEGGVRSTAYESCFSENEDREDNYRPLFWYTNDTKIDYVTTFGIKHSDCYTVYKFKRTGCCCCPYGWAHNELIRELIAIKKYEPKLYNACWNIFGDSYDYLFEYLKFREEKIKGKRKRLF